MNSYSFVIDQDPNAIFRIANIAAIDRPTVRERRGHQRRDLRGFAHVVLDHDLHAEIRVIANGDDDQDQQDAR